MLHKYSVFRVNSAFTDATWKMVFNGYDAVVSLHSLYLTPVEFSHSRTQEFT